MSELQHAEAKLAGIQERLAEITAAMKNREALNLTEVQSIEVTLAEIEATMDSYIAATKEAGHIINDLNDDAKLMEEGGRTLSKYTMLANAGGLALAISQVANFATNGHIGSLMLIPLWAFGIGVLASGMELVSSLATPMSNIAAGVDAAETKLKSVGVILRPGREPPMSGREKRDALRLAKAGFWLPVISQSCFATGLIAGLLQISFR